MMTLKDFLTGCVKMLGLILLMLGLLKVANRATSAVTMYEMSHRLESRTETDVRVQMQAIQAMVKLRESTVFLFFAVVQTLLGYYLCRREQRIVRFLLKE